MANRKKHAYPQQVRRYQFAVAIIGAYRPIARYRNVTQEMVFARYDFTEEFAKKKKRVFEERREALVRAFRYALVMEDRYTAKLFVKILKLFDLYCYQMNAAQIFLDAAIQEKRLDDAVRYIYFAYSSVCDHDTYLGCLLGELTVDSPQCDERYALETLQELVWHLKTIAGLLRFYPKPEDRPEECREFLATNCWLEFSFELDRAMYHLKSLKDNYKSPIASELEVLLHILLGYMPMPCMWSDCAKEGDTEMVVHLVDNAFEHCEERRLELEDLTARLALFAKELGNDVKPDQGEEPARTEQDVGQIMTSIAEGGAEIIKRRGKWKLNDKVGNILRTDPDCKSAVIAELINKASKDVDKPTSAEAVRKTDNWKNRLNKKQNSPKK